jgi:metallo-beta-lactamase family protein
VTFLGAARSVTGSMHLVESGPYRLLLDCGMTRGTHEERLRNRDFPFDPSTIDAVILSHAHVDHCGNLPNLARQGFSGPIYCTPPTRELLAVMLNDSARIHEEESRVANVVAHHGPAQDRGERRAFGRRDVNAVVEQAVAVDYGVPFAVNADVQVTFLDAGHILGSAIVAMKLLHAGREYTLTFTGDLGRRGLPFLHAPTPVPPADLIISECTYGGKTHDTALGMADKMADVVHRTAERGGKVLIPAFSLGRTQVVSHYVRRWMAAGVLPRLPVYVDSPLAADVSVIHDEFPEHLHAPAAEGRVPVEYLLDADDARIASTEDGPAVIIASGGMCEGGRILSHLKHHVDDPRSSVVLVSYQAPSSVGAKLLEKRPTVRFHGRNWNKWVEVSQINGFSGHADQNDFEALFGSAVGRAGKIRLVHGEEEQAEALEARLLRMGFADVDVPVREEVVAVG